MNTETTFNLADASSIAAIYLAMVGLLSSIFLFSLTQWLSGISGLKAKWNRLKLYERAPDKYEQRLDVYYSAQQARSWWIFFGWVIVMVFTWSIVGLQCAFQNSVTPAFQPLVSQFITIPCVFFAIIFTLLSLVFLIIGYCQACKLVSEVLPTV